MFSEKDICDYEKMIIGAVKLNNTIHDEYRLDSTIFNNSLNREIYTVITNLIESGNEANNITILNELQKRKSKISAADLVNTDTVTSANVKFYIDNLKEYNIGKKLHKLSLLIQDNVKNRDYKECINNIEKELQSINILNGSGEIYHIKDLLLEVINEIEQRYKNGGKLQGISSGYDDIDRVLGGFKNQNLIAIGARPSVGKTAIILNIINKIANKGIPCGLFSAETSRESTIERMIIIDGRINTYSLSTGNLNKRDFERMMVSFENLNQQNVYIDDTPNIKLSQLKSNALLMVRKGVKIIFVDYLTLIHLDGGERIPRHERVGIIAKKLKQLARELNVPIIILSQLSREAEDKRPTVAHLRQTGELEEDCDVICLLHGKRGTDERELIIAKNRDGALDSINLHFNQSCLQFSEIDNRMAER